MTNTRHYGVTNTLDIRRACNPNTKRHPKLKAPPYQKTPQASPDEYYCYWYEYHHYY